MSAAGKRTRIPHSRNIAQNCTSSIWNGRPRDLSTGRRKQDPLPGAWLPPCWRRSRIRRWGIGGGRMLNQQTLEKLHALHLNGMAEAYSRQMEDASAASLSFEERFGLLVDHHWSWRENQAMARRLKKSKLDAEPCVEDIDYRHPRGLDRQLMRSLIGSQWRSPASLGPADGTDRHRQVVAGTGVGAEGMPRRLHRLVPARPETVPRSHHGPHRR